MLGLKKIATLAALTLALQTAPASAETCDLTSAGSTCGPTLFNGAIFQQYTPTSGTTIDPFLRLQAQGVEEGYNTSASTLQYNQLDTSDATHDILLADVPIVTINGVEYREFYLDINEPNSTAKKMLSLDELRIYLGSTGDLTGYNTTTEKLSGLTAIYDLDNGVSGTQDNWIKLNYSLNNGSPSGDMVAYIPNSLFTGSSEQYVYLYSKFGAQGGNFVADGSAETGYEEWWLKRPSSSSSLRPVPEPALLLLFGTAASIALRRRLAFGRPQN